ncbi:MAG: restriction endonuclease [Nitrospirae bacterium]|nr:restriction endonuclease [Nitrospirota bacterium]
MKRSALAELRIDYQRKLCGEVLSERGEEGTYSIADSGSKTSIDLASRLVRILGHPLRSAPLKEQEAGSLFTSVTAQFLRDAFRLLVHLRPGKWVFSTSPSETRIGGFDQYEHLRTLQEVLKKYPQLSATLGGDYLITPDIIVARASATDEEINVEGLIVSEREPVAKATPLRKSNFPERKAILHASVSCKWTIRSDRSQNIRTEALNLIRNRKGQTPHIVAVTMEPMPSRIASIARGTGDIDCTYHAALHELVVALRESGRDDQEEQLSTLIEGHRLRDISDLPFDLAI